MLVNIKISCTETKQEVIVSPDGCFFDDIDGAVFYFEDGNGSCDCNRENLFRKAIGLPLLDLDELACSEGRFLIQMTSDTGKLLLSETIVDGAVHRTVED